MNRPASPLPTLAEVATDLHTMVAQVRAQTGGSLTSPVLTLPLAIARIIAVDAAENGQTVEQWVNAITRPAKFAGYVPAVRVQVQGGKAKRSSLIQHPRPGKRSTSVQRVIGPG